MDLNDVAGFSLTNLAKHNVVVGKNGCGKSFLLKQLDSSLRNREGVGAVRYISPERSGYVLYAPHVEQNINSGLNWLDNDRRRNQPNDFKQQSAVLYRTLETATLREIDKDRGLPPFSVTIDKINGLLDRVYLRSSGSTFEIIVRESGVVTPATDISSGESELISLAIEILTFVKQAETGKSNYLLIDEPDVHLHPDLQYRLAKFLREIVPNDKVTTIIATHSTAFLSALTIGVDDSVAFMRRGQTTLAFEKITKAYKEILPVFGAHPLSNVFNENPILLIEGEDDERIWQQAVRSAKGAISLFPCPVDGLPKFPEYESDADKIIGALYDQAVGYSLRDRDSQPAEIEDVGRIVRMRLNCRAAENLMLSDDVLTLAGTNWGDLQQAVQQWVDSTTGRKHKYFGQMKAFVDGKMDRKAADIKEVRNILLGMISEKPWEWLVGRAIAGLALNPTQSAEHSLRDYLGPKVCKNLLGIETN